MCLCVRVRKRTHVCLCAHRHFTLIFLNTVGFARRKHLAFELHDLTASCGKAWLRSMKINLICKSEDKRVSPYLSQLLHPDNKVHGANMGPIWGRQDPGGPHVGPMNLAIWVVTEGWILLGQLLAFSCLSCFPDYQIIRILRLHFTGAATF